MKKLTDKCCAKCIDSEFQRCPKVTECLIKRPLAECHESEACVEKRDAVIRNIRYGEGILLKLTTCSYLPEEQIGNIVNTIFMELRRRELSHVTLGITGGLGNVADAPFLSVSSPEYPTIVYAKVTEEMIPRIIAEHIEQKKVVEEWVLGQFSDDSKKLIDSVPVIQYLEFFHSQNLRVLRRCGLIDPDNLDEYFLEEGFLGLSKALNRMTPDEVINLVGLSGLRSRSGNGEAIIKKWKRMTAHDAEQPEHGSERPQKYLICNAHEGYDLSLKDRTLLESDPFTVLEGMLITAYAVRATHGIIYLNPAFNLAARRLQRALDLARESNYLGPEILGTNFSFNIEIRRAPSGYLVGEDTSIVSFLEGDVGTRPVPPYLEDRGLWGKPTLIHDVETLANIPLLTQHDFSWFTATGVTGNPGTKCLTLAGAVPRPGIIEVPLGTSLRDILTDIGGADPNAIKALHLGGPSGGYLAPEQFDILFDHDSLQSCGLHIGTSTIEILDQSVCLIDRVAKHLLFVLDELCGQCTAGREGVYQLVSILQAIREGRDIPGCRRRNLADVYALLTELIQYIRQTSLCGFCKEGCISVATTLMYFRKEYEDHLQKRCKAGVCF